MFSNPRAISKTERNTTTATAKAATATTAEPARCSAERRFKERIVPVPRSTVTVVPVEPESERLPRA